jgi:hypothetical protein
MAEALGLRPLDRLQIHSDRAIADNLSFQRFTAKPQQLPFWYFQRIVGDQLEVRSPGGYSAKVSPLDVCDVIPGEPLRVQAVPSIKYLQWLRMPLSARAGGFRATPDLCAPASVMHASRTRHGQFEFYVLFDDPEFNDSATWIAPLPTDERKRLEPLARRTRMPVSASTGAANHSADTGCRASEALHRRAAAVFVRAACAGNGAATSRLTSLGVRALSLAQINRLGEVPA